jgi:hypothetical protein
VKLVLEPLAIVPLEEVLVKVSWFPVLVRLAFRKLSMFIDESRSRSTCQPETSLPELFATVT